MDPNAEGSTSSQAFTGGACLRGIIGAWLMIVSEGIVIFVSARREITSSWELTHGIANLAPLVLPAAATASVVGTIFLAALTQSPMRPSARSWLTIFVALGCGAAAWSVGGGRHLATLVSRLCFSLLVGGILAWVAWWGSPRWARWAGARGTAAGFAALAFLLLLEITNRFVLVRLYHGFHTSFAIATIIVAPMPFWAWSESQTPRSSAATTNNNAGAHWTLFALIVLCIGMLAVTTSAARRLSRFDNFRLILIERAPVLGQAVKWAAHFAPPAPMADCGVQGWDAACAAIQAQDERTSRDFSLQGRDILMITVDALRADHLGAYGYRRATSPNIDRLASEAVMFNHAYAPTPHTSYSVTSTMTGKYMRPLLLQGAGEKAIQSVAQASQHKQSQCPPIAAAY